MSITEVVDIAQITVIVEEDDRRTNVNRYPVRKCFTCEEKNTLIPVSNKGCYWKSKHVKRYIIRVFTVTMDWIGATTTKAFYVACVIHFGCFPCMDKFRFETDEYGIEVICGDCKDKLKKRRKRRL